LSYSKLDFKTSLKSSSSLAKIEHNSKTSLGIGLRYYLPNI